MTYVRYDWEIAMREISIEFDIDFSIRYEHFANNIDLKNRVKDNISPDALDEIVRSIICLTYDDGLAISWPQSVLLFKFWILLRNDINETYKWWVDLCKLFHENWIPEWTRVKKTELELRLNYIKLLKTWNCFIETSKLSLEDHWLDELLLVAPKRYIDSLEINEEYNSKFEYSSKLEENSKLLYLMFAFLVYDEPIYLVVDQRHIRRKIVTQWNLHKLWRIEQEDEESAYDHWIIIRLDMYMRKYMWKNAHNNFSTLRDDVLKNKKPLKSLSKNVNTFLDGIEKLFSEWKIKQVDIDISWADIDNKEINVSQSFNSWFRSKNNCINFNLNRDYLKLNDIKLSKLAFIYIQTPSLEDKSPIVIKILYWILKEEEKWNIIISDSINYNEYFKYYDNIIPPRRKSKNVKVSEYISNLRALIREYNLSYKIITWSDKLRWKKTWIRKDLKTWN